MENYEVSSGVKKAWAEKSAPQRANDAASPEPFTVGFRADCYDAGTSESVKKAWATRKRGGGGGKVVNGVKRTPAEMRTLAANQRANAKLKAKKQESQPKRIPTNTAQAIQ